jgi:phosphoribosyl 1,2-cyclic phosphodiesterase
MKLTFLGTRGEIEARTPLHGMHTSLLVAYRRTRVMVDVGEDWRDALWEVRPRPRAIVITHGHPDHAWGLRAGSPAPVYATAEAWRTMQGYAIRPDQRQRLDPRVPTRIGELVFEAFPVEHSIRAPAVGFRISAGTVIIFYAPDLVYIHDRADALRDCRLYIGDGATLTRSFVRRRGERLIGHAPVRTQLTWCQKEGVPHAIITHCGTEIVTGDRAELERRLAALASERGVRAALAHDGLSLVLR